MARPIKLPRSRDKRLLYLIKDAREKRSKVTQLADVSGQTNMVAPAIAPTAVVTSLAAAGETPLTGNVTLSGGTNIALAQVLQDIAVNLAIDESVDFDFNQALNFLLENSLPAAEVTPSTGQLIFHTTNLEPWFYNGTTWLPIDDNKLMVSANDSTPGYLYPKVASSDATIAFSEANDGADERLNVILKASNSPFDRSYYTHNGTIGLWMDVLWNRTGDEITTYTANNRLALSSNVASDNILEVVSSGESAKAGSFNASGIGAYAGYFAVSGDSSIAGYFANSNTNVESNYGVKSTLVKGWAGYFTHTGAFSASSGALFAKSDLSHCAQFESGDDTSPDASPQQTVTLRIYNYDDDGVGSDSAGIHITTNNRGLIVISNGTDTSNAGIVSACEFIPAIFGGSAASTAIAATISSAYGTPTTAAYAGDFLAGGDAVNQYALRVRNIGLHGTDTAILAAAGAVGMEISASDSTGLGITATGGAGAGGAAVKATGTTAGYSFLGSGGAGARVDKLGIAIDAGVTYVLNVLGNSYWDGTGRFTGVLTVGAYSFPITDGSSGQVLKTNGAGILSWQDDNEGAGSFSFDVWDDDSGGTVDNGEKISLLSGTNITTVYAASGSNHEITINWAANLEDLTDVLLSSPAPTEGDVLTYQSGSWVNAAIPAPSLALDDLTDVAITTPSGAEVLTYNGANWVNSPLPAGYAYWVISADSTPGGSYDYNVTDGETVAFVGGEAIDTSVSQDSPSGNTVTINVDKSSPIAQKEFTWYLFGSGTAPSTGNGVNGYVIPSSINGWNLVDVVAAHQTYGSSGTTDIQVRRERDTAGVTRTTADMLTTKVTISASQYWASDGSVNTSNDDVQEGDVIYIDVDAVSTGSRGLTVTLVFQKQ